MCFSLKGGLPSPPSEYRLNLVIPFQQIEYASGGVSLMAIKGIAASLLCLVSLSGKASSRFLRILKQHSGEELEVRNCHSRVREPSWKQILQPESIFQMTVILADSLTAAS